MINEQEQKAEANAASVADAAKVFQLVDLTRLEEHDDESNVIALVRKSKKNGICCAGVCVYPEFIKTAKNTLKEIDNSVSTVVTVVNFPDGKQALTEVIQQTKTAIADGADEIDLVLPYHLIQENKQAEAQTFVEAIKAECGNVLLKVIIESGELATAQLIDEASSVCVQAGADFVKTSTGKVPVNATLEAANVILTQIQQSEKTVGFKAAGGVRDLEGAIEYIALAESIMGAGWVKPSTFRIGASGLVDQLVF
ncbi:deoxyribose-phosphate aldolase [Flocculibacter collagenilyticus]|uniref:deoxyribose-phosphate aldolase n=1 Tax=Flocculibacter collagenilyticus TaxID=2744479 RepID=UPI0018F3B56D|nr:deoxyribose-phosphate aldolase [Flocculibacter collagenilyticus]